MNTNSGSKIVPPLYAVETEEKATKCGFLKVMRAEKALAAAAGARNALKIALANHVPVAMGTDAGVGAHGTNMHELTLMVEWGGMKPLDAITASTMGGARLLGWDKRIGSITAGKYADIVAVPSDPLQDVHVL